MDLLLLNMLNAQSKGNPYHDKEGKFCSGPGAAFGMFARKSRFTHESEPTAKSAAKSLQLPRSGEEDIVMTAMTDEQLIATYECAIATLGVHNFNNNVAETHQKEAPKNLLTLNKRISDAAERVYQDTIKFALGTGSSDKQRRKSTLDSSLNEMKKMTDESQKCADLASKMKVPDSEKYAKQLIIEGNDALNSVYSTLSYISKNLKNEPRHFAIK